MFLGDVFVGRADQKTRGTVDDHILDTVANLKFLEMIPPPQNLVKPF